MFINKFKINTYPVPCFPIVNIMNMNLNVLLHGVCSIVQQHLNKCQHMLMFTFYPFQSNLFEVKV